jgi:hypothetical protein
MTVLLGVSGICILLCVIFETFFAFVPGGDVLWIFSLWMIFGTYGIASLCQILMFELPEGSTPTQSISSISEKEMKERRQTATVNGGV